MQIPNNISRFGAYAGLCLFFDWLFFRQPTGLNLAVFGLLSLVVLWWGNREAFRKTRVQVMAAAVVYAVVFVVLHGHFLSQLTLVLVSLSLGGLVLEPSTKFLGSGLLRLIYTMGSWWRFLKRMIALPGKWLLGNHNYRRLGFKLRKNARLSIFPLSVSFCFLGLYSVASDVYLSFWIRNVADFVLWLSELSAFVSVTHFLFLLWGSWVVYSLLFNNQPTAASRWEKDAEDQLLRVRRPFVPGIARYFPHPMALRRNYRSAVILLCMVNLVLLVFICFDFHFLWSNLGRVTDHREIREMVHQGTYVLLASISLAMFVLLWIFRGNINFLSNNRLLRRLAYGWLVLNGMLLISVVARNSYHIWHNGLGYLRIGVCAFLLLTIAGLIGMYFKIRYRKTLFYLFRTNAWAWLVVLLLFSSVEWNRVIVHYNLFHHSGKVRYTSFVLGFPDHTVDLMLEASQTDRSFGPNYSKEELSIEFTERAEAFLDGNKGMRVRDWRGWNFADYKTRKKLRKLL